MDLGHTMLNKMLGFVLVVFIILIVVVVLIFRAADVDERNRRTVVDSKGNQITVEVAGDPRLEVAWVDSGKWFHEEEPVGRPFYDSLTPAKPACPRLSEGESRFWDAVRKQECAVILYDTDKHAFRLLGFVQRSYGEANSGTDMRSAVLEVQEKFGRQFIRSGNYSF